MLRHPISPTVDCIFKAILGAEENKNLLIDFLNSVLAPQSPISDVEILNPYNEREFYKDKLTIVDIKAKDENGDGLPDRNSIIGFFLFAGENALHVERYLPVPANKRGKILRTTSGYLHLAVD